MLNFQINGMVSKTVKGFSKYLEVNSLMHGRCMLAIANRSMDGLCKEIEMKVLRGTKLVEVEMDSDEIERKLKEIGLWQIVANSVTRVTPEFIQGLNHLLLGSFGYAEVETIVRRRAYEAVEKQSMDPLYQEIDTAWRNGEFKATADEMKERLMATGIWQLVEREIH